MLSPHVHVHPLQTSYSCALRIHPAYPQKARVMSMDAVSVLPLAVRKSTPCRLPPAASQNQHPLALSTLTVYRLQRFEIALPEAAATNAPETPPEHPCFAPGRPAPANVKSGGEGSLLAQGLDPHGRARRSGPSLDTRAVSTYWHTGVCSAQREPCFSYGSTTNKNTA